MMYSEVNGTSLRWDLSGEGKTTIVLLHEMGGSLDSWDQVVPALNNGRRVLRYDYRGAGMSQKIKGSITWDAHADDLAALLNAAGIEGKVGLAGIAVGAGIAAHFAVRHADRAAGLVLHGPATGATPDRKKASYDRADAVEAGGMASVVDSSLALSYPPVVQLNKDTYNAFRARWLGNDPESFAALNRMLADNDITDELKRIACPTLVTAGRHDPLRPPSVIEPLSKTIPGSQYLELNSGHFPAVQTPGLRGQAIHYFFHAMGM